MLPTISPPTSAGNGWRIGYSSNRRSNHASICLNTTATAAAATPSAANEISSRFDSMLKAR
jgi:hypothetical protein